MLEVIYLKLFSQVLQILLQLVQTTITYLNNLNVFQVNLEHKNLTNLHLN